jgi:hypothetical protein
MIDLWNALWQFSLATVFAVGVGLSLGNRRGFQKWSAVLLVIAASSTILLSGRLEWTRLIPGSSAVVWSRSSVILLALAAGALYCRTEIPRWHRLFCCTGLVLTTFFYAAWPLGRIWVAPIQAGHATKWKDQTYLQSTDFTCAPSAAVTLLQLHGIPSTEREMVQLCLTSTHGTEGLGLYRGLTKACVRRGWRAIALTGDATEIIQRRPWPAVVLVRFPGQENTPTFFSGSGEGHAVVVFGESAAGNFEIGDPAFGRDSWTREELLTRWSEGAIRLVNHTAGCPKIAHE